MTKEALSNVVLVYVIVVDEIDVSSRERISVSKERHSSCRLYIEVDSSVSTNFIITTV